MRLQMKVVVMTPPSGSIPGVNTTQTGGQLNPLCSQAQRVTRTDRKGSLLQMKAAHTSNAAEWHRAHLSWYLKVRMFAWSNLRTKQ